MKAYPLRDILAISSQNVSTRTSVLRLTGVTRYLLPLAWGVSGPSSANA